jgi:hypothetical protein
VQFVPIAVTILPRPYTTLVGAGCAGWRECATQLIPERAPNVNADAERFVRSIKEECLDRLIPSGERNHHGLGNRLIAGLPVIDRTSRVRRHARLGGLDNFYERAA